MDRFRYWIGIKVWVKGRYMVIGHLYILVGVVRLPKRCKGIGIRLVYVCKIYRYYALLCAMEVYMWSMAYGYIYIYIAYV